MVRTIIFGSTGLLFGLVFGFAFFGLEGAAWGAIMGIVSGTSVAIYMNRNKILDRPFYTQSDADQLMRVVPYKTAGLPSRVQDWLSAKIRSILEGWL